MRRAEMSIQQRRSGRAGAREARRWCLRAGWAALVVLVLAASPAWAQSDSAPYGDVAESSVHAPAVAALASQGLLAGMECAPGSFCPGDDLPRWMMAVWLVRAVDGEDPAGAQESRFADVDAGEWWAGNVERLAELGITAGCAREPLRYCPDASVTRAQMASFLVRAFDIAADGEPAGFVDTAGSVHEADIDALAAAGVTAGCAREPVRFCPRDAVNRAEMATFLARALGLVALPEPPSPSSAPYRIGSFKPHASSNPEIPRIEAFEAWVINSDGTGLTKLADVAGDFNVFGSFPFPVHGWSSEGLVYLSTSYDSLWIVDNDGDNRIKLSDIDEYTTPFSLWSSGDSFGYTVIGESGYELWMVDADGSGSSRLNADGIAAWGYADGDDSPAVFVSPDGQYIAYAVAESDSGSGDGLWVVGVDGSNAVRVADYERWLEPAWSPDGRHISYLQFGDSDDGWPDLESPELWIAAVDGSNAVRIAEGAGSRPWWSPDGQYLAYVVEGSDSGSGHGLWVVGVDGSNAVRVADYERWLEPAWSPDGRHFEYEDSDGLWFVVGVDDFDVVWVSEGVGPSRWSPDSRYVAYVAEGSESGSGDGLWLVGVDGRGVKVADGADWPGPMWSPDSRHFAYVVEGSEGGSGDGLGSGDGVWVVSIDRLGVLWGTADGVGEPVWSPDGLHLAYVAEGSEGGSGDGLWVAGADGSDAVRVAENGSFIGWSPDGLRLAYTVWGSEGGSGDGLWVAGADGSNAVRVAENGSFIGWSPDGQYMAYSSYADSASSLWVVGVDGSNPVAIPGDYNYYSMPIYWFSQ